MTTTLQGFYDHRLDGARRIHSGALNASPRRAKASIPERPISIQFVCAETLGYLYSTLS